MKFIYGTIFFIAIGCLLPGVAAAMSVNLSIPEKYNEVNAGDTIYFVNEVKYPENDTRKDLRIEYYILDKDNKEVSYVKVLKAIETQASFMDSMTIPASAASGMYRVVAKIGDYENMSEEVGVSFSVVKTQSESNKTYLLIILILVAIIAVGFIIQLAMFFRQHAVIPVKKNLRIA